MAPTTNDKKAGAGAGADEGYVRLHITPFNLSLMTAIVPPSLAPKARNISFHTLQAFPEKEYGFIDLPSEEAGKIKRKLKGAVLRGSTIVIEEARGDKSWGGIDGEMGTRREGEELKEKSSKKRKRHEEPMKGAEVMDRQIKRGWTDPKASKKTAKEKRVKDGKGKKKEREKSKYTTEPECLFRTTLPPSVAASLPAKGVEGVTMQKERKKKKSGKDVVVHEFAKTEKFATFLRQKGGETKGTQAVEFIEGKGWVDVNGEVVESEPKKPKHNDDVLEKIAKENKISLPVVEVAEENESEGSDDTSAEKDSDTSTQDNAAEDSETSSSGTSSEDEQEDVSTPESDKEETESSPNLPDTPNNLSMPQPRGLTILIPPPLGTKPRKTAPIHPLEALYKPRDVDTDSANVPAGSSFTFFGNGNNNPDVDEDGEVDELPVPMTPFSKQDFSLRGQRSAAPTPDTAHPMKKHLSWPANDESEGEGDHTVSSPTRKRGESGEERPKEDEETDPAQDFQKWFYEHRGEANRAWKKRQKEVKKEARQRENKKRGDRGAA